MKINIDIDPIFYGHTETFRSCINFYSQILLNKFSGELNLFVTECKLPDIAGHCDSDDIGESPRYFELSLNKSYKGMEETIAHEMVHIKQLATNQLYQASPKVFMWNGKIWKPEEYEDDYYDRPWEIEAHGREKGLYQRWMLNNL